MLSSGDMVTYEDGFISSGYVHTFSKKLLSSSNVMWSGSRPIRRASYSTPNQLTHLPTQKLHQYQQVLKSTLTYRVGQKMAPFLYTF